MKAGVTAEQLAELVPNIRRERALVYAEALDSALPLADATTAMRVRHFVSQMAVESGYFRSLTESVAYRDPDALNQLFNNIQGRAHAESLIAQGPEAIANTIYANKLGNGGPSTGDGYRYRGRGFMMITGRGNYREIGKVTGLDLEENPDQLGDPLQAAKAAAALWEVRRINLAADANDVSAVTTLVSGPANLHLAERAALLLKAAVIWN